eukprot:CAMPEP_0168570470 /NCGR_PEP_ID=MMETSP0413-20121227/16742_1 /TAXON_ID=136452 /ORGANISM="Filamoeba nolandi, Strain NC-AS-23-1" /LENGTH=201 /DNA_ID=CAMNT_0008603103 /DNA_START=9 /DNA_END=611 /DNA_ORIENTATION=-
MTENDWKVQDGYGDTVLHKLVQSGSLEMLTEQSIYLADCSMLNHQGRSPLHEACRKPTKSLLTLLKSPKAQLTQPEAISGKTPFAILLRQYITNPNHEIALALQFLLNHAEGAKMISPNIAQLATPYIMEKISKSTEHIKETKNEKKIKFDDILKKPSDERYPPLNEKEDKKRERLMRSRGKMRAQMLTRPGVYYGRVMYF